MKAKYFFLLILCITTLWVGFITWEKYLSYKEVMITVEERKIDIITKESETVMQDEKGTLKEESSEKKIVQKEIPRKLQWNVVFVAQAPHAQWENELFQDACEEASVLMVQSWRNGREAPYSKDDATAELEKMFAYEQEYYGQAYDLSATDTAQFFRDYYGVEDVSVVYDITANDIVLALSEGKLVILPSNGQALGNPYFTAPGPERHMLVVTGYDQKKKEFITNDPGTRRGEDYRYAYDTLIASVRDYPTGHKEPITEERTVMIVVGRDVEGE